jgi:molecular chaperone DnaJ
MHLKDHYKVLGLHPSADLTEIRKAYRRLAMEYHPDKNNGDPYALEHFNAAKEAYEILTNPARKEKYLQLRWYFQSINKKTTQEIITPVTILKQSLELEKYVSMLDVHRMDKQGLQDYILGILDNDTIEKLNGFNDIRTNREIILLMLKSSQPLPAKLLEPVCLQLNKLRSDPETIAAIQVQFKKSIRSYQWEKYRTAFVMLLVLLVCLLIYMFS